MEDMDLGVRQKYWQILRRKSGATAIAHVLEELMWDHQTLVEYVRKDQAYKMSVDITVLWITVVVEILVAAGISVLVTHRQKTVYLREQNGSTMPPLLDTTKLCQYKHKHA